MIMAPLFLPNLAKKSLIKALQMKIMTLNDSGGYDSDFYQICRVIINWCNCKNGKVGILWQRIIMCSTSHGLIIKNVMPLVCRVCSHDVTAAMLEESTKKRWASWRSEIFFWELNSIFMQIPPFVSLCIYGLWSQERTHSIHDNQSHSMNFVSDDYNRWYFSLFISKPFVDIKF